MKGDDIVCIVKNSATLTGSLFTLHAAQIHIDLPTLSDKDKKVSYSNFIEPIKIILFIMCAISEVHVTNSHGYGKISVRTLWLSKYVYLFLRT